MSRSHTESLGSWSDYYYWVAIMSKYRFLHTVAIILSAIASAITAGLAGGDMVVGATIGAGVNSIVAASL